MPKFRVFLQYIESSGGHYQAKPVIVEAVDKDEAIDKAKKELYMQFGVLEIEVVDSEAEEIRNER